MSTHHRPTTSNGNYANANMEGKTYFEQQREMLVTEIAQSLEGVLQNINRLNRSLEEVVQVGNEFAPVESLWSHFESVMAKDSEEEVQGREGAESRQEGEGGEEGEEQTEVEGQK